MDEIPTELALFEEAGFRIEESAEISRRGPSIHSAAYIVAEEKTGGYSYGIFYKPGLSKLQLAALAEEIRARILSLVTEGPDGPYAWSTGNEVPGFYSWLALHDIDPTL